MTITIGTIEFDHVDYDADGDVLYLSVGEPREAAEFTAQLRGTMCDMRRADGSSG